MYRSQIWEIKSILYQIWFLSPPGFQQYIGTDFCSIIPNLSGFYNFLPYIVQIFQYCTQFGWFLRFFALYSTDFCTFLGWFLKFFALYSTDFCSILPNLGDFLPYIVQIFAVFYPIWVIFSLYSTDFCAIQFGWFPFWMVPEPDLVDRSGRVDIFLLTFLNR